MPCRNGFGNYDWLRDFGGSVCNRWYIDVGEVLGQVLNQIAVGLSLDGGVDTLRDAWN